MHEFLNWFNGILFLLFLLLYSYQFFYLFVALVMKPKQLPENPRKYRYCVLIAARNEENVIGNLIRSIREQTYPQELIHICVVADNCTDQTAKDRQGSPEPMWSNGLIRPWWARDMRWISY